MAHHRDSDAALLAAVASGSGPAFGELYERHLPGVLAFLVSQTGDRDLAADLSSEVFAAVLLSAPRFKDQGGSTATAWIIGIARNKLRATRRRRRAEDRARRRLGWEREVIRDTDSARVDELIAGFMSVDDLLERLPALERAAVQGRVLQQRSYTEIAHELHASEPAVRQRVSRGLARLRHYLTEDRA